MSERGFGAVMIGDSYVEMKVFRTQFSQQKRQVFVFLMLGIFAGCFSNMSEGRKSRSHRNRLVGHIGVISDDADFWGCKSGRP